MMKDVDRSVIEKSKGFDVITCYYQLPKVHVPVGTNDHLKVVVGIGYMYLIASKQYR